MDTLIGIAGGIAIIAVAGLILGIVVYAIRKHLTDEQRPLAFIVVFIALFICACAENWNGDTARNILGLPMLVLNAFGTATLAFIGGNGFTMLPALVVNPPQKGYDAIWLDWINGHWALSGTHIVFALLNILAFALTAEAVLSMFTNTTTWLQLHFHHYDDVIIVKLSDDMREQAQSFINDLIDQDEPGSTHGASGAKRSDDDGTKHMRHLIFRIGLTPTDDIPSAYSIILKDTRISVKRETMEKALASAITTTTRHNHGMTTDGRKPGSKTDAREETSGITSVVFRNGRITVFKHKSVGDDSSDIATARAIIDDSTQMKTSDTYSYSFREIQTRQFIRSLTDDTDAANAIRTEKPRLGLGLCRLNAVIVGDDVEGVVLMTVYLIRNSQSLKGYPTIHIVSANIDAIERRLHCAYPALFPITDPNMRGTYPLTPPATLMFHHTLFNMLDSMGTHSTRPGPAHNSARGDDEVTLVVFTSPDTGRAPSQRAIITRTLQRDFGEMSHRRLQFAQYSENEPAGLIYENEYGGRENPGSREHTIAVRLYGNTDETVSAQVILHTDLDTRSMLVNARYSKKPDATGIDLIDTHANQITQEIREAWFGGKLYDRESSRATADFLPIEREVWRVMVGSGDGETLKTTIGELEHMRWNAYMITCGYIPKPCDAKTLAPERDAAYDSGNDNLSKAVRIDDIGKRHLALVDWSYLPNVDAAIEKLNDIPYQGKKHTIVPINDIRIAWNPLQSSDKAIVDNLLQSQTTGNR